MSEILNDENVMIELEQKVKDFEQEIRDFEQKRRDLEQQRRDLEQKKRELEDLGDTADIAYFNGKIAEINSQIEEKGMEIKAITAQILEKGEKMKVIGNEILNVPEVPAVPVAPIAAIPPIAPLAPLAPLEPIEPIESIEPSFVREIEAQEQQSEFDRKIAEFERRIAECERKIEEKEHEIERVHEMKDREIEILENKKSRLEETYDSIGEKLDGNINDATRERLEEMQEEVEDKMSELEEQIEEKEEQKSDREDELNDEIEELHDQIEEINEEREEYENEYVDEDLISEIKNLPGFSTHDEQSERSEHEVKEEKKEINIKVIDEMEKKYADVSSEHRERRRQYRRESKYNVNFCSGAKIDSFCCHANRPREEGYVESPDCIIADDPGLKKKWYSEHKHDVEIGHPHWVIIDLGGVKTFNYVQIIKASEGQGDRGVRDRDMSAWRIEVCQNQLDKTNNIWTEFNRETNDKSSVYEKQFEPQSGRFIRLLVDAAEANPNHKFGHARIYGFKIKMRDETGEDIEDFTKKAKIHSCCNSSQNDKHHNVEYMLNDNRSQKWYATDRHGERITMPHWCIIDFAESKTFNHLRLVKASESGQDNKWDRGKRNLDMSAWRFEVSDDKEKWTEFNRETNDQSSIYIKTFEPQTGRYVRFWIDAPERDPNHKRGHIRVYDLRIEMRGEQLEDKVVTFDDIIAIAPFAKKETLDKLADKLTDIDNFAKIKEVGQFLSPQAIDKLILKAYEKDDFNAVFALAPYASKETLEKIALDLDSELDFDKIKALTPFLGKEAITGIILSGGQMDMQKLRELAPFLGSALIDEIVQRMF